MPRCIFLVLLLGCVSGAKAVDVMPSKQTVPEQFYESSSGGSSWSIFAGDPKRIEKANAVDLKTFEMKLEVDPNPLSLKERAAAGAAPALQVTLTVRNKGKKPADLPFPTSQRYDFGIKNAQGQPVYVWSEDKMFVESAGEVLLNPGDKMVYTESIPLGDCRPALQPGSYSVEGAVSGYAPLAAKAVLTVGP